MTAQGISAQQAIDILSRVRVVEPTEYQPNTRNHNKGTVRGDTAIDDSVSKYGLHRGIAVADNGEAFAGSHLLQSAIYRSAASEVIEVAVTGDTLVVSKRVDIRDGDDPKAIAAGLADNLTHQRNFEFDVPQFALDISELKSIGLDLPRSILTSDEIKEIVEGGREDDQNDEDHRSAGSREVQCVCPNCGHEFIKT
jgi:hypothetical protein